MKNLQFD